MIGKDTLPELVTRFLQKEFRVIQQGLTEKDAFQPVARLHTDATVYIAKNPVRAVQEGIAISESQIHNILKDLHINKGIGIVIIHGVEDLAFPMSRMQEVANEEQLDGFVSVKGLHDELHVYPDKYTSAAVEMLGALERKRRKNT